MIDKRSLHPIASPGGVICLLALDHREAMRNAFRRAGVEDVNANEILDTKSRIVEAVGPSATGVLLDHAAARVSRPDGIGLLVPLEEQGHERLDGARLNRLEFTAEDALRIGADGCKLLLHYRPDHPASAQRQREVVARAADDCHRQGLPLVLEPLVYRLDGESERAYTNAFANLVVRSASDLADSGADILKLQYPGDFAACGRLTVAASPLRWALLGGSEVDGETFAAALDAAAAPVPRASWPVARSGEVHSVSTRRPSSSGWSNMRDHCSNASPRLSMTVPGGSGDDPTSGRARPGACAPQA